MVFRQLKDKLVRVFVTVTGCWPELPPTTCATVTVKNIKFRIWFFGILIPMLIAGDTVGKIYYSKSEAMKLAFGNDAKIEMLPIFFTEEQMRNTQRLARVKIDSALFTFYVGKQHGKIIGYAAIETHTVRTKPETLLIVLTPEGEPKDIHILAFHEPPEYQPPDAWFAQLYHRALEELDFNTGVQGITGATLSTREALNSVRKVLAIHRMTLAKEQKNPDWVKR